MAFVELEYDTLFSRMARLGKNCLFRDVLMIRDAVFGLALSASGGKRGLGLGLGLSFSCEFGEDVFDLPMCVCLSIFPLFLRISRWYEGSFSLTVFRDTRYNLYVS